MEEYQLKSARKRGFLKKRKKGCETGVRSQKEKKKKIKKKLQLFYLIFIQSQMQTSEQAELISYVNLVCTPFSLAGVFYMIYSYFKTCIRSFSSKLVFCLALSDLLLSICDLIDIFEPQTAQNCTVVGFLRIFGIYSNMLWMT